MLLRSLSAPIRRRWRRTLHGSVMRGQITLSTLSMLREGAIADLGHELRTAPTVEARETIAEIKARAEEESNRFLIDVLAITSVRLADGEPPSRRTALAIGEYLRWRESMERAAEEARRARRRAAGTRVSLWWRDDVMENAALCAVVAGAVLLVAGTGPDAAAMGLTAFAGAVLLLAEVAYGSGCGVSLLWVLAGGFLFWKRAVIGEWASGARPWPLLVGVLLVCVMALLVLRRRPRREAALVRKRDPRRW